MNLCCTVCNITLTMKPVTHTVLYFNSFTVQQSNLFILHSSAYFYVAFK